MQKDKVEYGIRLHPNSRAWKKIKVGNYVLNHRIVMAPLTRYRAIDHLPANDLHPEYYNQRASDGGLIITEATFISKSAGGYPNAPGIYTHNQIQAWKKVTAAVHAKKGIIFMQLWAIGRANSGAEADVPIISSSSLPLPGASTNRPIEMPTSQVKEFIRQYGVAAQNAIEAGMDGVEIHGAHGYLPDQFLEKSCNQTRKDEYGGSLENRARFTLEILAQVTSLIGQERTGIRISPFSTFQGMGKEEDIFETFAYLCTQIKKRFPRLAYVSVTDPRLESEAKDGVNKVYSSDIFRGIFRGIDPNHLSKYSKSATFEFPDPNEVNPTVFISAGGYNASDAEPVSDRTGDLIMYGRMFISNPDLPFRIKQGLVLNPYDRSTFYTQDHVGYTTYPQANEGTLKFKPESKL